MPSLKDIRNRIASVASTQQITKAMKMVSGAKMRRAHDAVLGARPYAAKLEGLVRNLAAAGEASHPLLEQRQVRRSVVIVMTSDRGLCGGFNNLLLRMVEREMRGREGVEHEIVAVGRRGRDYLRKRGFPVIDEREGVSGRITPEFARELVEEPMARYQEGAIDEVLLAFNTFKSAISQVPTLERILPVPLPEGGGEEGGATYLFEPREQALLADLLPRYVANRTLRALFESEASEHSARMAAMDAATNNAEELIRYLTLTMNRARQAMITKEILEIVGGAEALASD